MADHAGWCQCPVLRFAAELERLAGFGMVADAASDYLDGPRHLVIASLRQRHGCRGPEKGRCPFDHMLSGVKLKARDDVPLLQRKPDRSTEPGVFL